MGDQSQQLSRILRSWHLVEFFQPYTIDDNDKIVRITKDELYRCENTLLPWLDPRAKEQLKIPNGKLRYTIYLGVFDKSEVTRISEQVFGHETDPVRLHEQEQRLDDEGATCFAKLHLDQFGSPNFEDMSVSTLPWALGHLRNGTADKLTYEAYSKHCDLLKEQLERISKQLANHPLQEQTPTLCAKAIAELLNSLKAWANFEPESDFCFYLEWTQLATTSKAIKKDSSKLARISDIDEDIETSSEIDEEEESSDDDSLLPILNSFYIEDIEKALIAVAEGRGGKALEEYLSTNQCKHADLYTQEGLKLIIERLQPTLLPLARWPSAPQHNMSLMQQFAINTAIKELDNGGILSVNGPPGTGKTTLLRDLVAHNLVERAKILSNFSNVTETIDKDGFLVEALGGFEMVVASSNNAAVENISRELPQLKSLGDEFKGFNYLKPVANQLAAKRKFKRKFGKKEHNCYFPLKAEEQCWGVIAAALGKYGNRDEFGQRFFFDEHYIRNSPEIARRTPEYDFLNFFNWKHHISTQTFSDAAKKFKQALNKVTTVQDELIKLAELITFRAQNSEPDFVADHQHKLIQVTEQYESTATELRELEQERQFTKESLEVELLQSKQLNSKKWGFIARIFRRKHYLSHKRQIEENLASQLTIKKKSAALSHAIFQKNKLLPELKQQQEVAIRNLAQAKLQYQTKMNELNKLLQAYPSISIPDLNTPINSPELQRNAFWQNVEINRARSELFAEAMNLHQAWLKEAASKTSLQNTLETMSKFLKRPAEFARPMNYWRTLFMMVPVVSTTFASLGRMFNGVSTSELGWLMIDEAGQAIPQAAVGGLLRAKRVLVVGDPLQIEPVFTTPPSLVKYICEALLGSDGDDWNPSICSVQQIADRANSYGCSLEIMNKPTWIGIPLWVHRRCIEPMFSLANKIAYDNRMIHGDDSDKIKSRILSENFENHWRISGGLCTVKQHKAELEQDTIELISKLLDKGHELSSIYVISPFKIVKTELSQAIGSLQEHLPTKVRDLKNWRKNNIGTVHTFQGKENDIVILVLGCDPSNKGGAAWASSKPNLLNVAVTRAKKNIFVVGDLQVWQSLPYFRELAGTLQAVSSNIN